MFENAGSVETSTGGAAMAALTCDTGRLAITAVELARAAPHLIRVRSRPARAHASKCIANTPSVVIMRSASRSFH